MHCLPASQLSKVPHQRSILLPLPSPGVQKPLASPEQATLAFAPSRWAAASAAPRRPAGMQGRSSAGPPAAIAAAAQEAAEKAEAAPNGIQQEGDGIPSQAAGRSSIEQQEQPAAEPEQEGGQAPIAANGIPTLEPILRALEMLGMQSQRAQQQQQQQAAAPQQAAAEQELPLPLLARERGVPGRHSARSSSAGPAVGSPPPGVATVTTGPFASGGLAGGAASGLLTPIAAPPAVPPFATPAALSGMQVVPSPAEPSPMALLAALSAAPDAAAAAKRRRRKQQQQQQQQQQQREAAASGRPPKPSRSRQAKRREDRQDGRGDQQQPPKRQRSRKAAAAAAAACSEPEQQPAERPATPSALPSDPRLPLYETSSAQGAFHYTFGRSLLFELPPPAPPLGEWHMHMHTGRHMTARLASAGCALQRMYVQV